MPHNARKQVAAGNALFHVVVDDDAVATRLVSLLASERAGRLTFVPLNRVQPAHVTFPSDWGQDAVPLVQHLAFDRRFDGAVRQVMIGCAV